PRKWGHRQLTDMEDTRYLAMLENAGNIGVALGKVSNGLVTIDLDEDNCVEPFLQENPLLAYTLRTRGSRGCNIWLRCTSEHPRWRNLTDPAGRKIGEWRADGCQTIITGTHPSGVPYQFVVEKPVMTINYDAIVWPTQSILPPDATESKRVGAVRRVQGEQGVGEKEVVCVEVCCEQLQTYFPTDLVSQIAPKDYHKNNASLFRLARLVKSYENEIGRAANEGEL